MAQHPRPGPEAMPSGTPLAPKPLDNYDRAFLLRVQAVAKARQQALGLYQLDMRYERMQAAFSWAIAEQQTLLTLGGRTVGWEIAEPRI